MYVKFHMCVKLLCMEYTHPCTRFKYILVFKLHESRFMETHMTLPGDFLLFGIGVESTSIGQWVTSIGQCTKLVSALSSSVSASLGWPFSKCEHGLSSSLSTASLGWYLLGLHLGLMPFTSFQKPVSDESSESSTAGVAGTSSKANCVRRAGPSSRRSTPTAFMMSANCDFDASIS